MSGVITQLISGVRPRGSGREQRLGTIVVVKPHNEPLSPTEISLAEHVASQAGLVVRNVRLTAELQHTIDELRASRGGWSELRTRRDRRSSAASTTAPSNNSSLWACN
jgi:GAF domain-containing protein